MNTRQNTISLILGEFESRPAFTRYSSSWCFPADVGTAMFPVHTAQAFFSAMYTRVLVIAEEEAIFTAAFVASQSVYTRLLTPPIVRQALIHITAVMAVVCQLEAVVARTSVVPGDVGTFVDTVTIVLIITFINVFTGFAIPFISSFAYTLI